MRNLLVTVLRKNKSGCFAGAEDDASKDKVAVGFYAGR